MKNPAALEVVMFTWDTWRSPDSRPPFCGVSYVCVSQQAHGGTVLCVRDGAFRVGYRVVLLDEKPCCA